MRNDEPQPRRRSTDAVAGHRAAHAAWIATGAPGPLLADSVLAALHARFGRPRQNGR